jgi:formate dehydrogenase subunit gamma
MSRPSALLRYTYRERIMHWLNALTYVYSMLTGLALYSPHLFWIAFMLGGAPTSRFWHPVAGVGFFLVIQWMHAAWRRDMAIGETDKNFAEQMRNYAANRDDLVPPQDRFNGGQKFFYWIMYYAALALLITGVVMWFPEYIPYRAAWIRQLAVLLHMCAALVTIGGFIVHLYMSLFLVPGSSAAMLFGYVSPAWARTHHRKWYERVSGETASD